MVKQFKINLNRQEGYAQRLERKRRMRERITLTVITLFVLVTMGLTYTADERMREIVQHKENQLEQIVTKIDSLQQAGQNVSKQDVLALARLDAERVLWTKKFAAISDLLPDNMAITKLNFDRGLFTIMAVTDIKPGEKEFDKVKLLMDRLQATSRFMEDFRDIKFKSSERDEEDGQDLLYFTITCRLGSAGTVRASQAVGGSSSRTDRLSRQLGG
jgi:Fimbrial assembly protein (PilN)